MRCPTSSPIFILGVPRSGTTLLRAILDSHSAIACGPETPWLAAHQPRSVQGLLRFLRDEKHGYCASFGMSKDLATAAVRTLVSELMDAYAASRGKRRWAEKTPDNVLFADFLFDLFPRARAIHLVRDGLDVAASTSIIAPHRRGISAWHEKNLSFGPGVAVANTPFAALLRWRHWNAIVARALEARTVLRVDYESLVAEPDRTVRTIMDFVGEPFEPAMLDYAGHAHDLPEWEWGSADVRAHGAIRADRVGRAAADLDPLAREILGPLASAQRVPIEPAAALAAVDQLQSPLFRRYMEYVNAFAAPLGLKTFTNWSKVWEYPWLWFRALARVDWAARPRLVDLGSELSPMPWIAALLGARVTLVERNRKVEPIWASLRDRLRVDVDWVYADSDRIPLDSDSADVLTSFSVIEHQPDQRAAIDEAARVLRPGGVLGLSFDICEPEMGMTFPAWNGHAMTLRDADAAFTHPAFGQTRPPDWNRADLAPFVAWHRQSAPHHNYASGAIVLRKLA
ncbi:MAG: sulfotransferase [Phycisphaerales bacterium]